MHQLPALLSLIASLVTFSAYGQIQASNPRYAGAGCPQDSVAIVFAPDSSAISILYSGMNVSSDMPIAGRNGRLRPNPGGGTNGVSAGSTECTVDIDIRIPVGMQLELTSVDYRGAVDLPNDQSYGTINSTTYFIGGTVDHAFGRMAGSQLIGGTSIIKRGPLSDAIFWQANYAGQGRNGFVTGKHISACRGEANLKIKTQTSTHTFDPSVVSSLFLDSADAAFSAQYGLTLQPCDALNRKREKLCSRGSCPK